jgi:hypothetical protein
MTGISPDPAIKGRGMTILILGGSDDDHAAFMLEHLRRSGDDAELLDSRAFPAALRLSFDPQRDADGWTLRLPTGRVLEPGRVRSVYWRCYNGMSSAVLPDPEQGYIAGNDARSLFESFLIRYPARWVNGWRAFQLHQTKPAQLALAAGLGVPVPATTLTNDPDTVRAFCARHPRTIFKPVQGGAHTRRVTAAHLRDDNLRNLTFAPVTLQEEVPGTNIRVFVAGRRVLACEVRSEQVDFRDTPNAPILPHSLPEEVAGWCLKVAQAMELLWTGIDLRRTPEGRYVFLEANPSPMFLGFESASGLPLTESLTALLRGTLNSSPDLEIFP